MEIAQAFGGIGLIFIVLLDAFQTVVLPRRAAQRLRPTQIFYKLTWAPWAFAGRRMRSTARRETFFSFYGPLSLLLLVALWALGLIVGFALIHAAVGSQILTPEGFSDFYTDLYLSGTTFFTLGLGDVTPATPGARLVTVLEAGIGFAFLALMIGYLPALNQVFSRREIHVSLLDERAGSPPSALELLRRQRKYNSLEGLGQIMHDWEQWSAELLEGHLSYPVLGYFRSQHENQSWVAALTTILDTSALVIVGIEGVPSRQAQLSFAMARHAAVDLCQVFNTPPTSPAPPAPDRLSLDDLSLLRTTLKAADLSLTEGEAADNRLQELRQMYEPYLCALAKHLVMPLPAWIPPADVPDAWQTTGWDHPD
jgi:voltage-gated potassium channel Kch